MIINKNTSINSAVFLFPALIATVQHGGGTVYVLLLLFGLLFGWPAWRSLEAWEKRVLYGLVVFFVLISLSLVNTQDFASGMKKIERYLHFPLIIPMYFLIKKYQVETGKIYLMGLLAASMVMFAQAYYQTSELGWGRAVGAYNPLILGDVAMLVVVIVACAVLTVSQHWKHYLLGLVTFALAISASIMSGSRGAWIALPVVALWLLWMKRKSYSVVSIILIALLGGLLVWGGANLKQVKPRVDKAVAEIYQYSQNPSKANSIAYRIEMWRDSVAIWKAHPIIGTGIGDFKGDRLKLFESGQSRLGHQFGHAHNIYFDTLATAGLLGLIGMVVFVFILPFRMFYLHWKKEEDAWVQFYALAGMATIISFSIFGLTEGWAARNPFVRTYLMSILVFMSSIAVVKQKQKSANVALSETASLR
ncbi:MAG: O-antigen ligase family protein [Ectothiorhodospiraceae bacterium]|nr:O-antigen ligase family protein [Ectothiorhodospiraceae bacterium]